MNWFLIEKENVINAKKKKKYRNVFILDEIGGHGVYARNFIRDLQDIDSDVINLHIDSPGGSITDGIAIYNALRAHPAQVDVYIDGIAASIASIIMLAGDNRYIPENASVFLHLPMVSTLQMPNRQDLEETADMLDKFERVLTNTYVKHTGASEETVRGWLESEAWFFGQDAVDAGLATEVIDSVAIAAKYDPAKYNLEHLHPTLNEEGIKIKEVNMNEKEIEVINEEPVNTAEEVVEEVVESTEEIVNEADGVGPVDAEEVDVEIEEVEEEVEIEDEEVVDVKASEAFRKTAIADISEKYDLNGDLKDVTIQALASDTCVEEFQAIVLDIVSKRALSKRLEVSVENKVETVDSLRAELTAETDSTKKYLIAQKLKNIR